MISSNERDTDRVPLLSFFCRNLGAVALVCLCLLTAAPGAGAAEEKRYPIPHGDTPYRGAADAPVTIIEFLDFQ